MDAQAHIIVSGRVQGVGYRYFVMHTARKYQLTGWVRNLMSGEVEIEIEGNRGLIESLIQELWTGNTWATVRNVQTAWGPFSGKYKAFDVRY